MERQTIREFITDNLSATRSSQTYKHEKSTELSFLSIAI